MRHILIVVHSDFINNYFAYIIKNLAKSKNTFIWLFIDVSMSPLTVKNWGRLDLFLSKINPLYKLDPFDKVNLRDFIYSLGNVKILDSVSNDKLYDWVILEDTIAESRYDKIANKGIVGFKFSYNDVIQEVSSSKQLSVLFAHKGQADRLWSFSCKKVSKEKGFKNNCDKVLWSFAIFLPSLVENDFEFAEKYIPVDKKIRTKILWNFSFFKNQFDLLFQSILRKFDRKSVNWKIAFERQNELYFLNQPSRSFWADPFFVEYNDIKCLFFEELDNNGKGIISAAIINECFEIIEKRVVIKESFHLSFPNVFSHDSKLFMIPESSDCQKVLLYQCNSFPFEWSLTRNIVDEVKLVDIVWMNRFDKFWIFANLIENFEYDNNERLYLFSSNDLVSGDWVSHPKNPVVTNKGSARNAGKLIIEQDELIRVSQNCNSSYGGNLVFNKIEIISETDYKEKIIHEKKIQSKYLGQHTWNESFDGSHVTDFLIKE